MPSNSDATVFIPKAETLTLCKATTPETTLSEVCCPLCHPGHFKHFASMTTPPHEETSDAAAACLRNQRDFVTCGSHLRSVRALNQIPPKREKKVSSILFFFVGRAGKQISTK